MDDASTGQASTGRTTRHFTRYAHDGSRLTGTQLDDGTVELALCHATDRTVAVWLHPDLTAALLAWLLDNGHEPTTKPARSVALEAFDHVMWPDAVKDTR